MLSILDSLTLKFLFTDAVESFLDRLSRGILCMGVLFVEDIASLRSESPRLQVLLLTLQVDLDFSIVDCSLIFLQVGK